MIPLLKKLGFLDPANIPTKVYSDFRDESKSKVIMAQQIRIAYAQLYTAHSYADKLKKEDIISKLSSVLGTSKEDDVIPVVASTFLELCKLADFEHEIQPQTSETQVPAVQVQTAQPQTPLKFGISYTINLNLPATTDIEVFNAIFKALKENLLK
jgi:hypothetical protein